MIQINNEGVKLYINQGDNTFLESASKYGLDIKTYAHQAAFFDYDIDGVMLKSNAHPKLSPRSNSRNWKKCQVIYCYKMENSLM